MIRKANIKDAKQIYRLINYWAKKGIVIERSFNYIYENIRDYWIFENRGRILGLCALHVIGWKDLGEIKSLVVDKKYQRKNIGTALVNACIDEAVSLKLKELFALTFVGRFFKKNGFKKIGMDKLPP
ncbi:MAG: GNAT family N-acetyltransferase [Candidatus Omnitrophota bacterium]